MRILIFAAAALAIVSLAAAQSVKAADVIYSTKSHQQPRKVVQLPDEIRPCSDDILCSVRQYDGFRDPKYTGSRKVRVREKMSDGTVGIRSLVTC
jgi:hypothetical protein